MHIECFDIFCQIVLQGWTSGYPIEDTRECVQEGICEPQIESKKKVHVKKPGGLTLNAGALFFSFKQAGLLIVPL